MEWRLPSEEQEALIALRRDLHRCPELAFEEEETAGRLEVELRQLGLEPQMGVGQTGVVAEIGEGEPVVALRADMDALPIQEETGLPFASERAGVMHACGHDAHMACLVAVARRLVQDPPPVGRVRLLFQPAEEGAGGALAMIRDGALEAPRPVAIYGLHFWSQLSTGELGIGAGAIMGSVDRFLVDVWGKGAHSAMPHRGTDALVAASYLVTSLQTLVSRRVDPLVPVAVTVGQFEAGTAFNVIPEVARLVGTVRTLDEEVWKQIPALFQEIVEGAVASLGCRAQIQFDRLERALVNHREATHLVYDIAQGLVPPESIRTYRTLGGEDFASYLEILPGCFFFVGAGGPDGELAVPHHSPFFALDEEAFPLGVRLLETCARQELQRQTP